MNVQVGLHDIVKLIKEEFFLQLSDNEAFGDFAKIVKEFYDQRKSNIKLVNIRTFIHRSTASNVIATFLFSSLYGMMSKVLEDVYKVSSESEYILAMRRFYFYYNYCNDVPEK